MSAVCAGSAGCVGRDGRGDTRLVEGISYDSRTTAPGWLFVCKGAHFSERYLSDALARGAVACVFEDGSLDEAMLAQIVASGAAAIAVRDVRRALPHIANHFYGRVWEELVTVAVTGTKGKSTTVYCLKAMLDAWAAHEGRRPAAVLSSIDTFDGVESFESHLTTPEVFELHRHFAHAADSGLAYLVMEVSSQALKYGRVADVVFDVGCFLNIGEDHISPIEHPDAEDYLASKLLLFGQCKAACINAACDQATRVRDAANMSLAPDKVVDFSADPAVPATLNACAVRPSDCEDGTPGLAFEVCGPGAAGGSTACYQLGMTGTFNVENALAALTVARMLGVPEEFIRSGLVAARASGRMELFKAPSGAVVIVDYAHNHMSFERLFASVESEYPGTRRTIVFGCPGHKALGRREELGRWAGSFCAMTYLTEEDAGDEPVAQICEQIALHVRAAGGNYTIMPDRTAAIQEALDDADAQTVVMITGKGRETRQKRGNAYVEVASDVAIVESWIKGQRAYPH
jgi:UDP-N-acetylmuramoyl-L-alanyl-D-glutamate--2,6-diaminopimelate ligase